MGRGPGPQSGMVIVFNILIVAGDLLLAFRLFRSGLFRHYRSFFGFLVFEALRGMVMAALNSSSFAYQRVWVLTEPLEWLMYVVVVLEIYALVLKDYRGLATAGRWSLIAAVAISMIAAALTLLAPWHASHQSRLMTYYYLAERAVYFSLAIFLVTILVLLMRYPIVLTRNIVAHSVIFSIYFLSGTVLYQLLNLGGMRVLSVVSYGLAMVNLAVLGGWLLLLNPAGEDRKQQMRPAWMPGREEDLVLQLNNLNMALLRLSSLSAR